MALIPGGAGAPTTFPDGFQILDGSASSPTIRWSSSSTGLYQPAPNQIAFSVNGTQVKLITSSSILFNVPLNIPSASNQIILSSGLNQLTINSGTSAAIRTYTVPDVGATGNFAMLEGLQTFAALKTFDGGIKFGGGAADNLSIWSTATTLNLRGGTAGLNISNSSGTTIVDVANSGAIILGSVTNTPYTSFHTTYRNIYSGTPSAVSQSNGAWLMGANSYNAANRQPARLSGLSGVQIGFDPQTSDASDCFGIAVNKVTDSATTVAIKVFGLNSNGSMSIGPISQIGGSTFSGASIVGRTDASSPATGFVGESVEGLQTTATNFPTTATYGDGTSITLTSGRWLLSASMLALLNTATGMTTVSCGIGTAVGNSSSGLTSGDTLFEGVVPTSTTGSSIAVPFVIKNISTSTTFYLKVRATYTGGNPQYRCRLTAIRIA